MHAETPSQVLRVIGGQDNRHLRQTRQEWIDISTLLYNPFSAITYLMLISLAKHSYLFLTDILIVLTVYLSDYVN
jgi:hypothetical protein